MNQTLGKLYVVGTPIGNLDDLSYRACKVLSTVDWIAAEDTRQSRKLLDHYNISKELISLHQFNEKERIDHLVAKLQTGETGALISDAGTPCVSDPGAYLIKALHEEGMIVSPLPGPCAAISAFSVSGCLNNSFVFIGFLPAKSQTRRKKLLEFKDLPYTVIIYEAPHRIEAMLSDCHDIFPTERRIVIGREITKKFETFYSGSVGSIYQDMKNAVIPAKGEFVVLIEGETQDSKTDSDSDDEEAKRVLKILISEMPVKQAVNVAVAITGQPKNKLYNFAIDLKK